MAMSLGQAKLEEYRRKNTRMVAFLLVIWFAVSIVGVWLVGPLNSLFILGFPGGYWLAAQGSVLVFIAEIFCYARYMDRLDRIYGFGEG